MPAEIKKQIQLEIAHVLFIDIVGYSKLSINEQRAMVDELTQAVPRSEEYQKAEAAGRLIKIPTGDGMALVFYTSPAAPAQCAVEISRALKASQRIPLRMGVHSGPVSGTVDVNGRPNLAGAGLNIALRVMNCGDAGHILVSKHVAEDLEEYEQWRPLLHELGTCEVKHGVRVAIANLYADRVGNPQLPKKFEALKKRRAQIRWTAITAALVGLVTVVAGIVISSRYHMGSTPAAPEKSIAVLPFENRSEDRTNAYFSDAIQDEILTRLSKIANLTVISRTSTQQYKTKPENLSVIARELGVTHILEGSVQRSGDTVRVNVQLIRAATDAHIWADTFDRQLNDIFSVESEVAKTIADHLRVTITGQEEQAVAAKPTGNAEAYDAYLRGLAYALKPGNTGANALKVQKYLRDAVRLDPRFALAWALLSYTDATGYLTVSLQPTGALREEARDAAEKALTLQPDLGEARLAVGQYHYACLKEYDTAVRYFEQARRLLPNSSRIPEVLAYVARRRGKWDSSESYFNEAERLDPRNVTVMTEHAFLYVARRRFSDALRKSDQILDIAPDDLDTLTLQAAVAQAQGDLTRSSSLLSRLQPNTADTRVMFLEVYQSILEGHPMKVVSSVGEALAAHDPAATNFEGEVRFWLGWAEHMAGDHSAAEQTWRQARDEIELLLQNQPENYLLIGDLALINMGLGNKAEALALAERGMAANPIEKDAISGPGALEILARVAAQVGEPDRAIAALRKLLSIPYSGPGPTPLTPALLRLDPMFDPLRNDEHFRKLVALQGLK